MEFGQATELQSVSQFTFYETPCVFQSSQGLVAFLLVGGHGQSYVGVTEVGADLDFCDEQVVNPRVGEFVAYQFFQFFAEGFGDSFGSVGVHGSG